jgi:hypothetical protein
LRRALFIWGSIGAACVYPLRAEVTGVEGPAQATWGNTVALTVTVRNAGDASAGHQRYDVALRRRAPEPSSWQCLRQIIFPASRATEAVRVTLALPGAPDKQGNLDGDFDIGLFPGGTDLRSEPLCPVHPVHIETRDARGRVGRAYVPRNYDLVGAQASPAETRAAWLDQTGIRHSRYELRWSDFEPEDGRWNESAFGPESPLGKLLLRERRYDKTVLLLFLGTVDWARPKGPDGRPLEGRQPAADPAKWAAFVDRVVGYYSQPPYLQQDWQVWNEASGTVDTGFWSGGSWENYVRTIHNPAADAIHRHYVDRNGNGKEDAGERCRVIYGGFPCSNWNDGSYARVLAIDGAGERTDILDAHYMQGLKWFCDEQKSGNVYDTWVASGKAQGCWQTEDGWEFAADPTWTPRFYFGDLHWALAHDWNRKDKYREYFFHYYAAQPNRGFFWGGDTPKWPNGYAIRTLMRSTRGDMAPVGCRRSIRQWDEGKPVADPIASCTPILAGGRLVLLFCQPTGAAAGTARFEIALRRGEEVRAVTRTSLVKGLERAVEFAAAGRALRFDLPWGAVEKNEAGMEDPRSPWAYLTVECVAPMRTWD